MSETKRRGRPRKAETSTAVESVDTTMNKTGTGAGGITSQELDKLLGVSGAGTDKETGASVRGEAIAEPLPGKETVQAGVWDALSGKETVRAGAREAGSGNGVRTVAESKGMTASELIAKRKLPQSDYQNAALQKVEDTTLEDGTIVNSNTLYIRKNLEIANLPEIDLTDAEQVQERINQYFEIEAKYGNKPTVAGLAMSLNGMNRRRLNEIVTGNFGNTRGITTTLPKTVTHLIKKAHQLMEQLWEDYMQNGKINPVSGIFLGKNNYGYQDKTEYVVTPNSQRDTDYSEAQIRERLGLPPADSPTSD